MHVWIVCDDEVYISKEGALKVVKKLLEDGLKLLANNSTTYRTLKILICEDVELALTYWNNHCPCSPGDKGVGSPISFCEADVR